MRNEAPESTVSRALHNEARRSLDDRRARSAHHCVMPLTCPSQAPAHSLLTNNTMPSRPMEPIKLLLDVLRHVFLDRVLFQCGEGRLDCFFLHVFGHWG